MPPITVVVTYYRLKREKSPYYQVQVESYDDDLLVDWMSTQFVVKGPVTRAGLKQHRHMKPYLNAARHTNKARGYATMAVHWIDEDKLNARRITSNERKS